MRALRRLPREDIARAFMSAPKHAMRQRPANPKPERRSTLHRPSTPRFLLEAGFIDAPLVRQRVGPLLDRWSSGQHPDTQRNRHLDLHQFAAYVLHEDLPPKCERDGTRSAAVMLGILRIQAGHAAAEGFLQWLSARGYRPATQRRKIKTLRLWARYLHDKQLAPDNLDSFAIPSASTLRARNEPTPEPSGEQTSPPPVPAELASIEELPPRMRARALEMLQARNEAIVGLLRHSSLKGSQLLDLDWEDVDLGTRPVSDDDDTIAPPARVRVSRRDGCGAWRHLVPHATHTMRRWYRTYVGHFCAAPPKRPVFATISGKRLHPSRLCEITGS